MEFKSGIAYLPDDDKPFTGKFEMYYSCLSDLDNTFMRLDYGSKILDVFLERDPQIDLKNHTAGAQQIFFTKLWHKIFCSRKFYEESYMDGKLNGTAISWRENGEKESEINYKNNKLFGLSTNYYEDGTKKSKNFNGILFSNLNKDKKDRTLQKMAKKYDPVEELIWYQDKLTPQNKTNLYLYFGENKGILTPLRLKIKYLSSDWLFINSFIVNADDKKFEKIDIQFNRDIRENGIIEWYDEKLSGDDLTMIKAIIESQFSILRFTGNLYKYDQIISEQEKQSMKNVLDAYEGVGGHIEF